ncbi:MAG: Hint domain-containing protein, partial [Bacteriovoracaceae bacterium]
FIDDSDPNQDVLLEPPPYSGVRRIRVPTTPTNFSSATVDNYAVNMYLAIEPDHGGINVWQTENKKYWIKIFAYVNAATNQITSCYDPTSEAAFCTDTMNGVYVNDPAIPADMRCRPDMGCFTYKNGVIPSTTACPPAPYQTNQISTTMKTCTWCPASPYLPGGADFIQTADGDGFDVFDEEGDDGPDIDCTKPNPWNGLGAREAYEDFLEYWTLVQDLPPDEQAAYAGCVNNPPPCFDFPETCANNCKPSAPTCNCASGKPDDYQTTPGIDPSLAGPATPCFDECTNTDNTASCQDCATACFIAGTTITMGDGSVQSIEAILKDEDVTDRSHKSRNVNKIWKIPYKGNIYGINGGRHFFTPNHPFMTLDGWKSLAPAASMKESPGIKVTKLKVGDILIKRTGLEVIYSLDATYVDDYVYNLTVDETHEYFADDYLVHNIQNKQPGIDCYQ